MFPEVNVFSRTRFDYRTGLSLPRLSTRLKAIVFFLNDLYQRRASLPSSDCVAQLFALLRGPQSSVTGWVYGKPAKSADGQRRCIPSRIPEELQGRRNRQRNWKNIRVWSRPLSSSVVEESPSDSQSQRLSPTGPRRWVAYSLSLFSTSKIFIFLCLNFTKDQIGPRSKRNQAQGIFKYNWARSRDLSLFYLLRTVHFLYRIRQKYILVRTKKH